MKKKVKIKDIALYSKGTQINGDELLEEAKFDYLNGGIKPSGKWDNANCVANTVTISEGGNSCGYVNFMKNPFWCGAHCYFLYDTKIDSKYLYYALKSQQVRIMKLRSGACMPNIKKTDLGNFEFVCDDNSIEQKKITHILDKLECVIEQRKNEIQVFDELVKARFVEMFGDLRDNGKGWEIKTLDELSYLITDGEHITPRRTTDGIYLLSARNILNHSLRLDDVDYIDQEEYARIAKRVVPKKGDVLISCSGTVGRCCSVPAGIKFQMVRSVALIRFKEEINPVFAEYMITSDYLQAQINGSKTASSQSNLFQGKIRALKGFAPPIELQIQFLQFVQQIAKSKAVIEKSLKELETLQASLMQKYFS